MDSKSKIPKFGFGMRRTTNGDTPTPPGTSPVSRSKSMKVQRTTIPIIPKTTKHSNSIDNDEDLSDTKPSLLLTPSSNYRGNPPKSQPSSRSVTPINDNAISGPLTRSLTVTPSTSGRTRGNGTQQRVSHDNTTSPYTKTHIRSSSFGSREKYGITPPSSLKKPTPTSVHHSPPTTPGVKTKGNSTTPTEPSRLLRRTSSNSKATPTDESDGNIESSAHSKPSSRLHTTPDSRRNSLGPPNGSGRRPNSLISFTEKSSDLNQLASEINEMGGESHVFGSTTPRNPSARSPRVSQAHVKGGGSSGHGISKLRPPIARNSSDDGNRPSSVTTNYNNESHNTSTSTSSILSTRPRSAADLHKIHTDHTPHTSSTTSTHNVNTTRRSSTPSSGRITPQQVNIQKSIAEESDRVSVGGQTSNKTVSATPRRPLASHTKISRTPFIRPGKPLSNRPGDGSTVTMAIGGGDDAVGLNELEGAVLLDAEDYRRMLQEVKNLKAILHRLKRELAADGGVSMVTPSMSVKSVARTENHDRTAELQKEIQKLTTERNKAMADLDQSQKKTSMIESKVQSLQKDLQESKQETNEVKTRYEELEGHRESLLDKVERLHADKHNLQDRLNTLEKSVKYESTILSEDWMEGELLLADNGLDYDDEDETY